MAKAPKKARTKKFSPIRNKSKHITNILNTAMHKFYILGDMNHNPMSFHISDIKANLRGVDLEIALTEVCKFLYGQKRDWVFAVYHFFKVEDQIQVIPSILKLGDTDLREVAEAAEENIKLLKDSVLDEDEGLTAENYMFYGYYINYGDNLRMDLMEDDIIAAFMKVNNDFENISAEVVECTAEKVLFAIAEEKFSITNSQALTTSMKEVL